MHSGYVWVINFWCDNKTKRNYVKNLILIAFSAIIVLASCTKNRVPTQKTGVLTGNDHVALTNFLMLGPLPVNNDTLDFKTARTMNFLEPWVLADSTLSEQNFMVLQEPVGVRSIRLKEDNISTSGYINFTGLFSDERPLLHKLNRSVSWFISTLESPSEQDLYLLFSGDDYVGIWVNGEQIGISFTQPGVLHFNMLRPVTLKKGKNTVVVKLLNDADDMMLKVVLATKQYAFDRFCSKNHYNFLEKCMISGNVINIKRNPATFIGSPIPFKVSDMLNRIVCQGVMQPDKNEYALSDIEPMHNYRLSFTHLGTTASETFFVGSPDDAYLHYEAKINQLPQQTQTDYSGVLYRFGRLMNITEKGNQNQFLRKICVLTENLERLQNQALQLSTGSLPTGIRIYGFRSRIDNSDQHYVVFAPDSVSASDTLPVVFVARPAIENHHPFLSSPQFAKSYVFDWALYMANRYRMYILFSSLRVYGAEKLAAVSDVDFDEVMTDFSQRTHWDTTRLYLHGNCLGAERALELATRFPHRFRAIGLYSPVFESNDSPLGSYATLQNIKHIPVYVHYDRFDGHTPASNIVALTNAAQAAGLDYTLHIDDATRTVYNIHLVGEETLDFFSEHNKPLPVPKMATFKTRFKRYNKGYLIDAEPAKEGKIASVDVQLKSKSNAVVSTQNVAWLLLNQTLHRDNALTVVLNDTITQTMATNEKLVLNHSRGTKVEFTPVFDVFGDHFTVVYQETEEYAGVAQHFCKLWNDYYFTSVQAVPQREYKNSGNVIFVGNSLDKSVFGGVAADEIISTFDASYRSKPNEPRRLSYMAGVQLNDGRKMLLVFGNASGCKALFDQRPWLHEASHYVIRDNAGSKILDRGYLY